MFEMRILNFCKDFLVVSSLSGNCRKPCQSKDHNRDVIVWQCLIHMVSLKGQGCLFSETIWIWSTYWDFPVWSWSKKWHNQLFNWPIVQIKHPHTQIGTLLHTVAVILNVFFQQSRSTKQSWNVSLYVLACVSGLDSLDLSVVVPVLL